MGHRIFVNVHRVQRAFGGPEEGGWWYDRGNYLESIETAVCVCNLPLTMLNIQLHRHEDNCGLHALVAQTRQRYAGHLEEWILWNPAIVRPNDRGRFSRPGLLECRYPRTRATAIPDLEPGRLGSIPSWGIPGSGVGFPI